MQFELTLNFDYIDTTVRLKIVIRNSFSVESLDNNADWLLALHGNAYTNSGEVGNNETTPLNQNSLIGEFTSESRINETKESPEPEVESFTIIYCDEINWLPIIWVVDKRSRRVPQLSVAAVAYMCS